MERFKEAEFYTNQPIVFESNHVEIQMSTNPDGNWTIKTINSHVVSYLYLH